MRNSSFSSLLFGLLAAFSLAVQAAETPSRESAEPAAQVASPVAATQAERVDLNSADAQTLERVLVGVGAVKAQAIIEHRQANGPFTAVDQLLEVKGIGAATLEKNRDKLSIN